MSIQSIGATGVSPLYGTTPTSQTSPPPAPQLNGTLDGIAQSLSLSPDALRSALSQGQSITDLAQQQGVSRDSLVQSVESQIQQQRQANGQDPLDQTTLDRMVNRAFDSHRTGGHHHHHRAHGAGAADAAAAVPAPAADDGTSPADTSGGVDVRV
jgi:hypothetical protein